MTLLKQEKGSHTTSYFGQLTVNGSGYQSPVSPAVFGLDLNTPYIDQRSQISSFKASSRYQNTPPLQMQSNLGASKVIDGGDQSMMEEQDQDSMAISLKDYDHIQQSNESSPTHSPKETIIKRSNDLNVLRLKAKQTVKLK